MSLTTATTETAQIVSVHVDRIDAAIAIQFKDDMRTHTRDGPERVILDLSSVDFIDSSGLGAIVAAMKHIGEGRRLDLAGLTPTVEKVFHLTRMDTVFTLYPTLDDAISDE
jgi:anti-sigma B factor antagonist